jgi:HK97 family phage major capsid protein
MSPERTFIMSKRLNELRQEYNSTVKLMRDLHNAAEAEKRGFSTDEQAKYDTARKGLDELRSRIEREEELADTQLRTAQALPGVEGTADDPDAQRAQVRGGKGRDKYDTAFRQYLVGGNQGLNEEQRSLLTERRDLSLTGASGGFTVPQGFQATLMETMRAYGAFLNPGLATILDTDSGNPVPVPLEDDTANSAAIVTEGTALTTSTDATFSQMTLGAFTYRALVRVSLELLQDSAFDIEAYVSRKLGMRLGRGFNAHASTGTNTGQPQGIFNATVGASIGHTGATGNATSFSYLAMVALEHSLDPAYRQSAKWMFGDGILQGLKSQLDTTNRPIWMPDYAVHSQQAGQSFPGRVLGYEYTINQDAPAVAANARSVAFGDFSYYMVRRVRNMMLIRADQRFIDQGQIGFYLFARMDGKYANPTATAARSPIRLGQNSAT